MSKISIIGAGTWGIALANMLSSSHHDVTVWSAVEEEIDYIQKYRKHPKLKNIKILDSIKLTIDIAKAIENQNIIVIAVPSIYVRSISAQIAKYISSDQIIVDVAKGIEANTLLTMSEIIYEEMNRKMNFKYENIVALSGPTHAEEVAIGLPSTIVSSCVNETTAKYIQEIFTSDFMRVYTNTDIKGVEICGALKNIIALAAGISHGLGYGDNAIAALVTRGINEITRLGIAMGCSIHTFYGLAGIGDLVVTCTSLHSRNNQCGMYIGNGLCTEEAIDKVGMVVEGINALDAAISLSSKYKVELPIINAVYNIVKRNEKPDLSVKKLFDRENKAEIPFSVLKLLHENLDISKKEIHIKRVITYGTFDLLHYGHINLLRRAKSLGDYLIVALSTDDFVKNEKGKNCYFNYEERKSLLEAIKYVDLVIPEHDWKQKTSDFKKYHISTFVMGDDWKGKFDYLENEKLNVIYLPRTPEISTTKIKNDLN